MRYLVTSGQIKTMVDCGDDLLIEREDLEFDNCWVPICHVIGTETIRYEHELEKRNKELESYIKHLTFERDNFSTTAANLAEENLKLKGKNIELERENASLKHENEDARYEFYSNIYISDDHVLEANQAFSENVDGSLIEEMSELAKALCKYKRTRGGKRDNIVEEVAHVLISIKMLCRAYGINPSEIEKEIVKKNPKFYDLVTGYDCSSDKKHTVWSITGEKSKLQN